MMKTEDQKDTGKEPEIMTLQDVARYLKVAEKSVLRMIHRGEIPCVKVASQWRFMRSVVNDWLISNMPTAQKRHIRTYPPIEPDAPLLVRLISPELVRLNIKPGTRTFVLSQLIAPLIEQKLINNGATLLKKLIERENMVSTAIGPDVSIPHARTPGESEVNEPCVVIGICKKGTDFHAVDGGMTYVFLLICSNTDVIHLRLMARIVLLLRNPEVIKHLRSARSKNVVIKVLIDTERNFLGGQYSQ